MNSFKLFVKKPFEIDDEIYKQIIQLDQTQFPFPFSKDQWLELQTSDKKHGPELIYCCVDSSGILLGFALVLNLQLEEMQHLLKILVNNSSKRSGIGAEILDFIYSTGCYLKSTKIFLEVDKLNLPAISLYKKKGFKEIDTKRNFYSNGNDAIVMERLWPSH